MPLTTMAVTDRLDSDTRRCPFDGQPLRRQRVGSSGAAERTSWICLRQQCTYAEPDDPQALFRLSWLRPLYRALWTRAEFRERSIDEQWIILQQAARQVTESQGQNEHFDLSGDNPAEVLSWLEAARRRTQR
ncbi:MAG: hypothetical protein KGN76_03660 [Acidobacteriota bacterium]|nr:hypothetical protein [Acidobacteriota bacterium]